MDYWLGQGASPSTTVDRLVRRARSGGGGGVALVGASAPVAEGDGEDAGGVDTDAVEVPAAQPAEEAAAPEPATDPAPGDDGAAPEAAPA